MHRALVRIVALSMPLAASAAPATIDPIAFFVGKSEGRGTLKKAFSATHPVFVRSEGRIEPDGTLVIQQHVEGVKDKPMERVWRLRRRGDHIEGSITDASTPVNGEIAGSRVHLVYTTRNGLAADQWMAFAPDGRSVQDTIVLKKFGITVATVTETIRKLD